jgi:HEAT repeat protein
MAFINLIKDTGMKKMMRLGRVVLWLLAGSLAVGDSLVSEKMKGLLERSMTYDFGQSRALLTEIEDQMKSIYGSPEELRKAEAVLLAALESESSLALKDFICRQLSVIGTEQSVPALARMLGDAKTAAPAQYALVRISSPAADAALIEHLSSGDPSLRIGILSTLGMRKSAGAVGAIAPLMSDPDKETADAAISAMGQIGTADAAKALQDRAAQIAESLKPRLDDALLACAENLTRQGDSAKAMEIFKSLYTAEHSVLVRSSALSGLVRTMGPGQSDAILLEALNDADLQIRTAAIRLACQLPSEKALTEARRKMPQFSPVLQIRFLTALGEFKAPYAKETALAFLDSESAEVRLAACETLAIAGDGSCVLPLAKAATEAQDRSLRESAREALSRSPDAGADRVIAEEIDKADLSDEKGAKVAAELIRAVGQRNIRDAMPAALKGAWAENRTVRREALMTLQAIAEPADLGKLVDLMDKSDADVNKMLVVVAMKEKQAQGRARQILLFLQRTQNESSKSAAYQVLGSIGDPDSLEVLRAALKDSNPALREAAFRGLAEWPGPDVMDDMKRFVREGESETIRVIAFRAYVRMVRQSDLATESKVSALAGAISMAPRESENKAVLAALGELPSEQALAIAVENLENTELKAEAQAAVLGICKKLSEKQPGMCRTALTKLLESSPNEAITNQAKEILNTIK